MKKITIVTVNFNNCDITLDLLLSLKILNHSGFEVKTLVCDNGSTDDSVAKISKRFPEVDILQIGENLGFTGGYNQGVKYALLDGADYILIINNDTLVKDKNLLFELAKTLEKDKSIGLVAPKIYFAPGFEFFKERYRKDDLGKVIWFAGGEFDWNNIYSKHLGIDEIDHGQYTKEEESPFISGCCFLGKREVFLKAGLFEEKLFAYFEDADFIERVKKCGFKIYYNGNVAIYHKISQTAKVGSSIADYYLTRNRLYFGLKYASLKTKLALIRQSFRFLISGRPFQRKGVLDFIRGRFGGLSEKLYLDVSFSKDISIIIVNFNTINYLKDLLKSIYDPLSGIKKLKTEVIVVDNNSDKSPEELIKLNFPQVKLIRNNSNLGFSKANNLGIDYSLGKFILLLNSDIKIMESGILNIYEDAEKYQANAVIAGKLYNVDGTEQPSCFKLPTIWGAIKEYVFKKRGEYRKYLPNSKVDIKVECAVMACFLIPRKIINKVGKLNEQTFAYFEDLEYCRRLKRDNIPIYFAPKARFIHFHGGSFSKLPSNTTRRYLEKGAIFYHGAIYYYLLSTILKIFNRLNLTSDIKNS